MSRAKFGVDGTGVKIGVLSDGVNSLAASQSSGNLPSNVTVLPGQAGEWQRRHSDAGNRP